MTSWRSIHLGLLSISDSSLSAHRRIMLAGEGSFAFSSGQVRPTRGSPALRTSFAVKKNLTAKNAKDSQRTQSKSLGQVAKLVTTGFRSSLPFSRVASYDSE